ncbi:hypothetical protein [Jeotgalibacillus soli]|uniref:Uncharacterized protein n=1 Tax=Jeotgalibacillus soli TaxID=889306 RepID=A0A0C2W5K8_9BACL|nr:hypothetical protein [Jeotgalibacillus soli]KIL51866.1 hypothetical protein KP78_02360 [Jeotgalibacillus soli]
MSYHLKNLNNEINSAVISSLHKNAIEADVYVHTGKKSNLKKAHKLGTTIYQYEIYMDLKEQGLPILLETT